MTNIDFPEIVAISEFILTLIRSNKVAEFFMEEDRFDHSLIFFSFGNVNSKVNRTQQKEGSGKVRSLEQNTLATFLCAIKMKL